MSQFQHKSCFHRIFFQITLKIEATFNLDLGTPNLHNLGRRALPRSHGQALNFSPYYLSTSLTANGPPSAPQPQTIQLKRNIRLFSLSLIWRNLYRHAFHASLKFQSQFHAESKLIYFRKEIKVLYGKLSLVIEGFCVTNFDKWTGTSTF